MDEELDGEVAELIVNLAEEKQTLKILLLLEERKDLEEARAKVKALLPEQTGL